MTQLTERWYLDHRHIVHACAPGVRVHWAGTLTCECGVVVPRRVRRFHEWMTDAAPARPAIPGLTLIVSGAPSRLAPIYRAAQRSKS